MAVLAVEPDGPPMGRAYEEPSPGSSGPRRYSPYITPDASLRPYGLADIPLTYDPAPETPDLESFRSRLPLQVAVDEPKSRAGRCVMQAKTQDYNYRRLLVNLAKMPQAVFTAHASCHSTFDWATVAFMQQAGLSVDWIRLEKYRIQGNGHLMFLETNSDAIAKLLHHWIASRWRSSACIRKRPRDVSDSRQSSSRRNESASVQSETDSVTTPGQDGSNRARPKRRLETPPDSQGDSNQSLSKGVEPTTANAIEAAAIDRHPYMCVSGSEVSQGAGEAKKQMQSARAIHVSSAMYTAQVQSAVSSGQAAGQHGACAFAETVRASPLQGAPVSAAPSSSSSSSSSRRLSAVGSSRLHAPRFTYGGPLNEMANQDTDNPQESSTSGSQDGVSRTNDLDITAGFTPIGRTATPAGSASERDTATHRRSQSSLSQGSNVAQQLTASHVAQLQGQWSASGRDTDSLTISQQNQDDPSVPQQLLPLGYLPPPSVGIRTVPSDTRRRSQASPYAQRGTSSESPRQLEEMARETR